MNTILKSMAAVAAAVAAVGCSSHQPSNYEHLTAHKWELTQIVSDDSAATAMTIPAGLTIQFSDSARFFGFGGCNSFFGTYSTVGQDNISIQPVGRSMAFCPDIALEDKFIAMLGLSATYVASDSTLQLNDNEAKQTLMFKAVAADEPQSDNQ
ncbi:MAG: META domain-containing protein [Rikenellaceae bacterium]|nr:META domain-containing protein [Rikenellaceae bacterium]